MSGDNLTEWNRRTPVAQLADGELEELRKVCECEIEARKKDQTTYEWSDIDPATILALLDRLAAKPVAPDLSTLTRYDAGVVDREYGVVGFVQKPVGRAVMLKDVEAIFAAPTTKETT